MSENKGVAAKSGKKRAADIKKNGKLVIDLYCESNEVGGAKRMGTVMLNSI